ncbi:MAG: hypothetical protein PVH40_00385 [Gemmatimonadales bacterium]|jgi:hypothetical protein
MADPRQNISAFGCIVAALLLLTAPTLAQSDRSSRFDFLGAAVVANAESGDRGDAFGATIGAGYRLTPVIVPTLRADVWSIRGQPTMLSAVQLGIRFDLRPVPNLVVSPALGFGPGVANVSGGLQFVPFGRVELQAGLRLFKRARLFGAAGYARTSVGVVDRLPREMLGYRYLMVGFTLDPWARPGPYPEARN